MRISDWSSDVCSSDLAAGPIDLGDVEAAFRLHGFAQFGRGGRLTAQVQLAHRPLAEGGDDQAGAEARRLAAHRLDLRGGPFIGVDGAGEIVFDIRTKDLDRDVAAGGGYGAVDRGDG